VVNDLNLWNFMGRRKQIVHEGLGDHLALVVIDEFFHEGRPDAVSDATKGHAADDVRVDHCAAVVTYDVAANLGFAEPWIDDQQHNMELESMDRVHLDAAVGRWQSPAGWNLHDISGGKPRLEPRRQPMEAAVGDVNELREAALGAADRVADITGGLSQLRSIDAEIVGCNRDQSVLEFCGRMKAGAS
jgi:hypothetical protein